MNAFYDLLNKRYVDAFIQPGNKSNERYAKKEMVLRYDSQDKTIFIGDRGYENYNNFMHISKKRKNYLVRVKDRNSNGILSGLILPDEEVEVKMKNPKIMTHKKEIERLVDNFFGFRSNKQLKKDLTFISETSGVVNEFQFFEFLHNLDEYDISRLQIPINDKHIWISVDYPVAEEDCEAYVLFEEFYDYLEKSIHQALKRGYLTPEGLERYDKEIILELLEKVKIFLKSIDKEI